MSQCKPSLLIAAALLLGGCTLIPDYERPAAPLPAQWPQGPAYTKLPQTAGSTAVAEIGWQEFFTDPVLKHLIGEALKNNRNARIAVLQVQQLQAQYRLQRAELFPEIDANANYSKRQTPSTVFGGSTQLITIDTRELNVGITNYELDLFGRVRSLKSQALQQYLASAEALRSTQVALIGQVATSYLNLLADRRLLKLADKTIQAQQQSTELVRKRFEGGIASKLDLRQVQTALQTARADRAQFRRQLAQSRNALRLLVGGALPATLDAARALTGPQVSIDPVPNMDSSLLLRRPDVLAAEHQLKAANADIGAARAAFFPRITLTGSYGTLSSDLDGLFGPASETWTFAPSISVPLFTGGRNTAKLDVAKISKRIEVARYEQTLQTAFREVSDALAARGTLDEERAARQALVAAAGDGYALSRRRYRGGIDNYLAVLDSQRSYYNAEQSLIRVNLAAQVNNVTLYKVLGGGWRQHTAAPAKPGTAPAGSGSSAGLQFWSRLSEYR